ncbi:hypothetical protein MD484_g3503, partial [Candolleomyces efflorescens]
MSLTKGTKNSQQDERQSPTFTVSQHLQEATALTKKPEGWNELWDSFDRYYIENEKTIMEAAQLDMTEVGQGSSKKAIRYEAATTSFLENSKMILHGLQFLSEIHPAISVAVGAFAAVIKIELIRRDNNAKAMGVKLQMQNLMCTLYQIRNLRTERHDFTTSARLANMMSIIAEEIKACGSDLSYYQDKKLISRLIHAQFFEQRLASHITTFAERRSELELLIASYTAGRVHDTAEIVSRVEFKVDSLLSFLHRLETPREKEAVRFIETNGGIENCFQHDGLLEELLFKTGEHIDELSEEETKKLKSQLAKELTENVEELLKKNMANFEGMLRIQNNNIQHMAHAVENSTSQIMKLSSEITMMFPGMKKHVLLTDRGLRQSVKAKKFVLTFKDYHIRMNPPKAPTILATPNIQIVELPPSTDLESSQLKQVNEADTLLLGADLEREMTEDEWALEYIDVVHLDPIVEAIDDDFSGFISIHEANRFAVARPKGWSLLRWFAYWAAGWAISVKRYKEQIYDLVQEIFKARLDVLPCNRTIVADYLESSAFQSLDSLLRSTQPHVGEYDAKDGKLKELISNLDGQQEERLLSNLKDLKYNVSSTDKVTLVTGPGRIERFAFPLIYLLLKHHLHVIRLASQYRLCSIELTAHSTSLLNVLDSLRHRADNLEAIFRQKSRSIHDQFEKFSFGMFERFNSSEPYAVKNNSMLASDYHESSQSHPDETSAENTESSPSPESKPVPSSKSVLTEADKEALKYLVQDLDHEEDRPDWDPDQQTILNDFSLPSPSSSPVGGSQSLLTSLSGTWSGRMYRDRKYVMQKDVALFRFDLPQEPAATEFEGVFEGWSASGKLKGSIEWGDPVKGLEDDGAEDDGGGKGASLGDGGDAGAKEVEDGRPIVALQFTVDATSGFKFHFRVTPVLDYHGLHWKGEWKFLDYKADTGVRPFDLLRISPDAARFRHFVEDMAVEGEPLAEASQSGVEPEAASTEILQPSKGPVEGAVDGSSKGEHIRKLALARWRLAREATLFQARRQLWSTSYFKQMANERRRWITAAMKADHGEATDEDMSDYITLRKCVHPNISSVWHGITRFYLSRQVGESITSYTRCDSCRNQFCFLRHICIVCCLESLNNQVDICEKCIDKKDVITTDNFTHRISHTMFKTLRHIPPMEFAHIIPQARIRSRRVKASFRSGGSHHHAAPSKPQDHRLSDPHLLAVSEPSVSHTFDVNKAQDVLICMDCESKKLQEGKHDASHYLLRIYDNVDVEGQGTGDQAEKYLKEAKSMLVQEMEALEGKIDKRMKALTEHVEEIRQAVSTAGPDSIVVAARSSPGLEDDLNLEAEHVTVSHRLENLEKQVNSRFESMEAMLRRILEAVGQGQ